MFKWKVEDMALLNEECKFFIGKERIFECENKISREDKIAFVDFMHDGKLSYLLSLIEKFEKDKELLPKDDWGSVKTVSLKAWIKRNDTKYNRPIIDDTFNYGKIRFLAMERYISNINNKYHYDTYSDLVDEIFHRQLKECMLMEQRYFFEHDEYSILKEKFRNKKYCTTFGVKIADCSNGELYIYEDDNFYNSKNYREITIDELRELLCKYEELDKLVEKLTKETNIVY